MDLDTQWFNQCKYDDGEGLKEPVLSLSLINCVKENDIFKLSLHQTVVVAEKIYLNDV